MSGSLSDGTTTISPQLILGYDVTSENEGVLHRHLDGTTSNSLQPDDPRSGELGLLFATEAAAQSAYEALRVPAVWVLTVAESSCRVRLMRTGLSPADYADLARSSHEIPL